MTRKILFCILALTACGDNLRPETPEDAGPDDDATPLPPQSDGEYLIKVSPTSFTCYDEPREANEFYTIANVVPQEDGWKFDLSGGPQNSFVYYDRYNLPWEVDGYFQDEEINNVSFGPGINVKAKRFVDGSANPDGSLTFFHSFDLGIYSKDDSWNSFCLYEADINGARRYTPWDETPRTSIDGQWRVKKTVLDSPLNYPTDLPYVHFVTMDTITQTVDDLLFDIRGIYHNSLEWYTLRNPTTGAVYALAIEVMPNGGQTAVYETILWGTLLPDVMDLEFSWRWYIAETSEVKWFQHEHYEGVPRYNEHDLNLEEPRAGAYNAEYKLLENNCDYTPYTEHRVLDVWPMDDGSVWPKITGLNIEPTVHLGPNGELAMTFSRYINDNTYYVYSFNNSTINGHAVDLNMAIDVFDGNGTHLCLAEYKITGQKRYQSYR